MNKFRSIALGILDGLGPQPNPFAEQAKELLNSLDPGAKAQVLVQLAVVEELNQLRSAVNGLSSVISVKS